MNFVSILFDKTINFCKKTNSEKYLYFVSLIESIFFPIPTDPFLIAYIIANKTKFFRLILLTTLFSVLGGAIAYFIGFLFWEKISAFSIIYDSEYFLGIQSFNGYIQKYGILFIIIGGFSPFPFKITCLGSGIAEINIFVFLVSSILSRGVRFFLVGYLFYKYNRKAYEISKKYINWISVILVTIGILYILLHN